MKVIVVLDIEPDKLLEAATGDANDGSMNIGEAVEREIAGWHSGEMSVAKVFEPDEIHPNDATLGEEIRKHLNS